LKGVLLLEIVFLYWEKMERTFTAERNAPGKISIVDDPETS
jgi:hypothetical protein